VSARRGSNDADVQLANDLAEAGAPPAEVVRWLAAGAAADESGDLWLWADLAPAFELLRASGTQWRAGFGGAYALDYSAVRWIARVHKVRVTPQLLADLAVLESAAVETLNERQDR
jgi:hypothetical protein